MDSYTPCDAPRPREELLQLLTRHGVPFRDTGEEIRFALCEGGCQWEVVCRFAPQMAILYGIYPFLVHNRAQALEAVNAAGAQLRQGGLFVADDRVVLRVSAALPDVYLAQEALVRALEYSASVMRYFWEKMRRCTE